MKVKVEFAFDLANNRIKYIDTNQMQPTRFFHHQFLIQLIDDARHDRMGWAHTDLTLSQYNEIFDSEFDWETMATPPKEFEYPEDLGFDVDVSICVVEKEFKGIHPGLAGVLQVETNDEKYDAFVAEFTKYRSEQIPELDPIIFNDPLLITRLDNWVNEKAANETQTKDYVFNIETNSLVFIPKNWRDNGVPAGLEKIPYIEDVHFLIPAEILTELGLPTRIAGANKTTGTVKIVAQDENFDINKLKQPLIDAGFEFDGALEFGEMAPDIFESKIADLVKAAGQKQAQVAPVAGIDPNSTVDDALAGINDPLAKSYQTILDNLMKPNPTAADIAAAQQMISKHRPQINPGKIDASIKNALNQLDNSDDSAGQDIHTDFSNLVTGGFVKPAEVLEAEKNELIIDAVRAGKSLREVGREFNIDHRKVSKICEASGVYSKKSKKNTPEEDLSLDDLENLYKRK